MTATSPIGCVNNKLGFVPNTGKISKREHEIQIMMATFVLSLFPMGSNIPCTDQNHEFLDHCETQLILMLLQPGTGHPHT